MLLKKYDSNTFQIKLYELCKPMNDKPTKNIYNALMKSLDRMCEAHITIEKRVPRSNNVQTEINGPIITSITKSEESGKK